jgi:hypothetical protein
VNDDEAPQGESLEEGTRAANSNLQRLLEAIGGVLTASADVLVRLQRILSGTEPAADSNGPDKGRAPQLPDHCDC